jgi:hypothetical protein
MCFAAEESAEHMFAECVKIYVAWVRVRVSYPIRCGCGDMENLKKIGYGCGYI